MEKDGFNHKRGHAIIGFNHGLPWYVKNMVLGPQSGQNFRPTASVFVVAKQPAVGFYNPWADIHVFGLLTARGKIVVKQVY